MVAILICNKHDARCRKYIEQDEFFTDNIDTSKERTEQHRKMACLKYVINRGNVSLLIY